MCVTGHESPQSECFHFLCHQSSNFFISSILLSILTTMLSAVHNASWSCSSSVFLHFAGGRGLRELWDFESLFQGNTDGMGCSLVLFPPSKWRLQMYVYSDTVLFFLNTDAWSLLWGNQRTTFPGVFLAPCTCTARNTTLWHLVLELPVCDRICEKGPHPAKLTFPVRSFVAGHVNLGRSSDFFTNR